MEDYDDLMLIWTPQSETLKDTYGEYLLVDLLEREGEENQAAVCEVSLPWPLVCLILALVMSCVTAHSSSGDKISSPPVKSRIHALYLHSECPSQCSLCLSSGVMFAVQKWSSNSQFLCRLFSSNLDRLSWWSHVVILDICIIADLFSFPVKANIACENE